MDKQMRGRLNPFQYLTGQKGSQEETYLIVCKSKKEGKDQESIQ